MIIGMTGLAGSGKNTVANLICEMFPDRFELMSSGSALKDVVAVMFGWDRKLLEGDTLESRIFRETKDTYWTDKLKQDWTPRKALQWLGTDIVRNQLDYDFWLNVTLRNIEKCNKDVIITDVRFANEIRELKKLDAKIIRVCLGELPEWFKKWEVLNKERYDNGLDPYQDCNIPEVNNMHKSETEWIGVDNPDIIIHPMEKGIDLLRNMVEKYKDVLK